MPFFRRAGGEDREARDAAAAEQEASLEALQRGGLPLRAQRRLSEMSRNELFTSDLSVNEFALAHSIGLRPLGQVMGSSIYHVGWQQSPGTWAGWQAAGVSQELTTLSEAWNTARQALDAGVSGRVPCPRTTFPSPRSPSGAKTRSYLQVADFLRHEPSFGTRQGNEPLLRARLASC